MSNHRADGANVSAPPGRRSLSDLAAMKPRREPIVMVTAYDAPSARLAESSGVDILLVGDSAAMTMLGHDSTVPVTMDEMLVLSRAVARGTSRVPVVADMPFGSFQVSNRSAVRNAVRFVKEAGVDAVKVEGAGPTLERVAAIVAAGIPVVGHVGLTPQSVKLLGGYKAQGRTARAALALMEDAQALERAGCAMLVLEAVPAAVAAAVTDAVAIPTIGIGAGAGCDGQVLVWHDLLGISQGRLPRFVKQYADIGGAIAKALDTYVTDVRQGRFPDAQHTYPMNEGEVDLFRSALAARHAGAADR